MLAGIGAQHVGTPEIRLPLIEYRAEVQINDVIVGDPAIGCVIVIGQYRIGPGARNAIVLVAA
jgi:hypothetical protein